MPLRRQASYRFFAGLLLYPERERIENLKAAARWLSENDDSTSRSLDISARVLSLNGNLTALQSEYVRLFQSSPRGFCYPYEGAYVDPERKAELSFRLECEYAVAGLKLATKDFPDHAATELEFMSYLCGHEVTEEQNGVHETAGKIRNRELIFLRDHLSRWIPGFSRKVADSGNEFYSEVCREAVQVITSDKAYLEKLIPVM